MTYTAFTFEYHPLKAALVTTNHSKAHIRVVWSVTTCYRTLNEANEALFESSLQQFKPILLLDLQSDQTNSRALVIYRQCAVKLY
jgi:hypothetical protein